MTVLLSYDMALSLSYCWIQSMMYIGKNWHLGTLFNEKGLDLWEDLAKI